MADNKLTWTELRRALAQRAGVTEKEANTFLSAFNAQLIEALKQDKQVKVNGLGMFKLQAVAPRKSVNVKTGEQITIEGYNKLSFVPEAGVKELVEKGEVRSETANAVSSEIDPLKKLGAQAEEIVDILGELGQPVNEPEPEQKPETPEVPENPEPAQEPAPAPEPEPTPEPEPAQEPEPAPIVLGTKEPEEKSKKQYHFVRDTLICVVILLLLLLVGYFFLRSQISGWIENLTKPQPVEVVSDQPSDVSIQHSEVSDQSAVVSEQPAEEAEWTYDEILLTEEIPEGSRLAWMAKKHYGDKAYWPYIYAANKDRIKNPSLITVGTPIRVPKLSEAMRDTTNVRFQQLKEEAYGAVH